MAKALLHNGVDYLRNPASTVFDAPTNTWVTLVPTTGLSGNVFLAGLGWQPPVSMSGVKNIRWSGKFSTDTAGVTMNWQWGAAVYGQFGSDYNALGVKPVDSTSLSKYKNSDHAGTPELLKCSLKSGGTGGGGSNYTGAYSGTAKVCQPCVVVLGSSLSGYVYRDVDNDGIKDTCERGVAGVTLILTGVNDLNEKVYLTTTTDSTGAYDFINLRAGTYTVTEIDPSWLADGKDSVGTINGQADGVLSNDKVGQITLGEGQVGMNYNFGEI